MKNCEPFVFGPLFAMQSKLAMMENHGARGQPRYKDASVWLSNERERGKPKW